MILGHISESAEETKLLRLWSVGDGGASWTTLVGAWLCWQRRVGDVAVNAVVRASDCHVVGGLLADESCARSVDGVGADPNRFEYPGEGSVDGSVKTRTVECPQERVMRGMGDSELLEGQGLIGAVDGGVVDRTLNDGVEPAGEWRRQATDHSAVDEDSRLIDPVLDDIA